jgi:hypothetical protein
MSTRISRTVRALLNGSLVVLGALTAVVIGGAIPASTKMASDQRPRQDSNLRGTD